jgi:hypothetical protein
MSGIAIAASTMPGSVATFCSCSSERSARIAERISTSANTRAGTRMSSRASAGSSYSVSSIQRGSDIEDDPRVPDVAVSFEPKPVIGRRFHDRVDPRPPAFEHPGEATPVDAQLASIGNEPFRVCEEDELLQESDEQAAAVRCFQVELVSRRLAVTVELDVSTEGVSSIG